MVDSSPHSVCIWLPSVELWRYGVHRRWAAWVASGARMANRTPPHFFISECWEAHGQADIHMLLTLVAQVVRGDCTATNDSWGFLGASGRACRLFAADPVHLLLFWGPVESLLPISGARTPAVPRTDRVFRWQQAGTRAVTAHKQPRTLPMQPSAPATRLAERWWN
jgi:hypothetical protein